MQIERRFHPRKNTRFDVEIDISQRVFPTKGVNISIGGVQVESRADIMSAFDQLTITPIQCRINLLSRRGEKTSMDIRLLTKRRLSQHDYVLGFRFINLSMKAKHQLSDFIKNL